MQSLLSKYGQLSGLRVQAAESGGFDFVVTPLRSGGDNADLLSGSQAPGQALSAADALYVEGENASQVRTKTTILLLYHNSTCNLMVNMRQLFPGSEHVQSALMWTAQLRQHGCQHSLSSTASQPKQCQVQEMLRTQVPCAGGGTDQYLAPPRLT